MEIISQIDTENGLEIVMKIDGEIIKKVFTYDELNQFIRLQKKRKREDEDYSHNKRSKLN